MGEERSSTDYDAIIVGAGFAGLFMLHRLRERGFTARVLEAADGIGGTWYYNRYPGARCDIESMQYSYSFSDELQQEWKWTELYSRQPEILAYLNHVADRFDLRKDIALNTRVLGVTFDEKRSSWTVTTDRGQRLSAQFCIMATGCLSNAKVPDFQGLEQFQGKSYHTGQWPHEEVQFDGQRVAVIGTGSSGTQSIPLIAERATHLYVFQRTANFSVPAWNRPLDPAYEQHWKSNYASHRKEAQDHAIALFVKDLHNRSIIGLTPEQIREEYEKRWQVGGLPFLTAFDELLVSKEANTTAADFVRDKIREIVKDPTTAECLLPLNYPIGAKRLCVDTGYYQTYNRDNVTLVDLRQGAIDQITPTGIRIKDKIYEVDTIVFATGFDAMTGALLKIDIQGPANINLRQKWTEGPRTYLGLMVAGFPNLFTITGPGSPSVLTNMVPSIELHVDIIAECLAYLRAHHYTTIEATIEAENAWVDHVNEVARYTLFPSANTWYNGSNIPGKAKVFMPYPGGHNIYRQKCEQVISNDYEGFTCA